LFPFNKAKEFLGYEFRIRVHLYSTILRIVLPTIGWLRELPHGKLKLLDVFHCLLINREVVFSLSNKLLQLPLQWTHNIPSAFMQHWWPDLHGVSRDVCASVHSSSASTSSISSPLNDSSTILSLHLLVHAPCLEIDGVIILYSEGFVITKEVLSIRTTTMDTYSSELCIVVWLAQSHV